MSTRFSINVGHRITIIATCFSLPIVVLFYYVSQNIGESIAFAQLELKGNAYQRPLEAALENVVMYQTGLRTAGSDNATARARVNKAMSELSVADKNFGVALQFTAEGLAKRDRSHLLVANLQKEWDETAAASDSTVNGEIDHIVADLRAFIGHAGDTSNLILDSDLDSYYLMDVTLVALPQAQDRLAKVSNLVADLLARGHITTDERVQIALQAALMQESNLEHVIASSSTSLKEDLNFYGVSPSLQANLPPAVAAYEATSKEMIDLTRKVAAGEAVDRTAYLAIAQKAIAASFSVWHVGVGELDGLLQTRINAYTTRLHQTSAWSALAVLISVIFTWIIKNSITMPLIKLVGSLGPGSVLLSECAGLIKTNNDRGVSNREETALICGELMAHANDMKTAVTQLEKLVGSSKSNVASVTG